MKTIFRITFVALALTLLQACGPKAKENESTTTELTAEEKAAQDKLAADKKREADRAERLRKAAERRASAESSYKDAQGEVIYNKPEVAPAFPGGEDAMRKYFQDNLKYPTEAEAKGWEGIVYVDFVIGKDGKVRQSTVTDETDEDIDQSFKTEALRVVDNMPAWKPGMQVKKAVPVRFNLPIAFQLQTP